MSLVLLAVDGEEELKLWRDKLDVVTGYMSYFEEPYWDNRLTAVACYGPLVQDFLKELRLL